MEEALEALEQPGEAPLPARDQLPALAIGLAVAEAQQGRIDQALQAIETALDFGFDDPEYLQEDELLAPVREKAAEKLAPLIERAKAAQAAAD